MLTGYVKRVIHLSQQSFLPNTRLVSDHNDKGYGVLEAQDGQEVFFPHEAVESRSGFEDVRNGQMVEYTLETASYLRAKIVKLPINTLRSVAPWRERETTHAHINSDTPLSQRDDRDYRTTQ